LGGDDGASTWTLHLEAKQPHDNGLRWLTNGAQAVDMLRLWDRLLAQAQAGPDGMAELQRILRSAEPECQRLREFAPLAGMIPPEKRRQARDLCGYRH
jgi:hypothetical protein